jgi:hypothetical protein
MAAHKEPSAKSVTVVDVHVFAANVTGPRDWNDEPIECLACPFPRGNAVHRSSEEIAAGLPPVPPEDRSNEMTGEH